MELSANTAIRDISRDGPPLVMAEIGVNHDGDASIAERLVQAARDNGAAAVKFQLFRADLLLAREAGLVAYQKDSAADAAALLRPLELSVDVMQKLIKHAQAAGLAAVVTPFSIELVPACLDMGVDAIKLASPDLVNRPLLDAAIGTGLPLIVSTGAATVEEVERTVDWLGDAALRTILLHCVSSYPTPPACATLGGITAIRRRFPDMPVGYSDHTIETTTGAYAVCAGACLLEKHLTLDRRRPGPDHAASLEPPELALYARLAHEAWTMRGPLKKQPLAAEMEVRQQTRQSVTPLRSLPAGTVLTRNMLTVKRPGTGIPAAMLGEIIGKHLARTVEANRVLQWEDLETISRNDE